jgi:hypothetical protein
VIAVWVVTKCHDQGSRFLVILFPSLIRKRVTHHSPTVYPSIGFRIIQMKPAKSLHRGGPFFILLGFAMTLATNVAVAQCPNRGTVFDGEVSNAQGKPYQAKEVTTIATYDSDGTKHVVVTKTNLFRDTNGRIRQERFYDGTADPSEDVPADIWIDDNCGTSVLIDLTRQTAKITKSNLSKISDQPYCAEIDFKNIPYTGPAGRFEDLGHKIVDGVRTRGERISYYSSVQAKLSGASPGSVYENWCSISLKTRTGFYSLEERPKREITAAVTDIRKVEPDPGLFEIPRGYKIIRADQSGSASNVNTTP